MSIINDALVVIEATVRALTDLGKSLFRRALKAFESFVKWLMDNLENIYQALKFAKLLLDLYNAVRSAFGI
jgi:hypothetical protein